MERKKIETKPSDIVGDPSDSNNNDYSKEDIDTTNDEDFIAPEKTKLESNKMVLRNLAKECDRWGVPTVLG